MAGGPSSGGSSGSGSTAAVIPNLLQRLKCVEADDCDGILRILREGEDAVLDLHGRSQIYGAAVNAHKCLGKQQECDLCIKHLKALCELNPAQAREFHNRQRAFGLSRKDARMYEARAMMEHRQGDSVKAMKMLQEGIKVGAHPVELLKQCLAPIEGALKEKDAREAAATDEVARAERAKAVFMAREQQAREALAAEQALREQRAKEAAAAEQTMRAKQMIKDAADAAEALRVKKAQETLLAEQALHEKAREAWQATQTSASSTCVGLAKGLQALHACSLPSPSPTRNRTSVTSELRPVTLLFQEATDSIILETRCERQLVASSSRGLLRSQSALDKLIQRMERKSLQASYLTAWRRVVESSQGERSAALFDSMGQHVRAARQSRDAVQHCCQWRQSKQLVALVFKVWQCDLTQAALRRIGQSYSGNIARDEVIVGTSPSLDMLLEDMAPLPSSSSSVAVTSVSSEEGNAAVAAVETAPGPELERRTGAWLAHCRAQHRARRADGADSTTEADDRNPLGELNKPGASSSAKLGSAPQKDRAPATAKSDAQAGEGRENGAACARPAGKASSATQSQGRAAGGGGARTPRLAAAPNAGAAKSKVASTAAQPTQRRTASAAPLR